MWYDAIILVLLLFCTIRGASKGFAWQIATIGALAICFLFAESASLAIAPLIKVDPPLNRWIAMFVLYIGASFVSFAVARTVRKTLESWQFVEYDKHLGAIFGFVKGGAFALVLTFFAVTLSERTRADVLASYSGFSAGHIMSALHPVMPTELHPIIDPYLEKLGQTVVHGPDYGTDPHDLASSGDEFGTPPLTGAPRQPSPSLPDYGTGSADDFGSPPPDFGTVPDWPAQPRLSTPTKPSNTTTSGLERIIDDIPDDLKQAALTAIKNTKPEDRDELLATFRTAIPGLIKAVSMEWEQGKPPEADRLTRRDETLREIAAVYTTDLAAQRNIIRQAEEQLSGVPDDVAEVVIQDWYADLLRLTFEDPDPATDLATRLDVRIQRQLAAFGISTNSLNADLRTRLGSTPR
ncbi:MAG: CvpA family protein [Planctomycetota bacterium]|nr:CvpA family protein [Planctomycetaceae bacterium]MDQ3333110.1 CvpA family protein [Planctomycetota bacterium]